MKKQKLQLYTLLFGILLVGFSANTANARFILTTGFPSPSIFSRPVDNPNLPRTRGVTQVTKTEKNDTIVTNQITTTFDTITVQGIPCAIIYNLEWTYVKKLKKQFLTAETYSFYAWDNKGNVWEFGKDSLKYQYNNKWRRTGINTKASWLAGKNKAVPFIVMQAKSKKS